jgi:hypothetical protein
MKELTDSGIVGYKKYNSSNLNKLPYGSVLSWDYEPHGHAAMVIDGKWVSDYWSKPYGQPRSSRGRKVTPVVYVPVSELKKNRNKKGEKQ